MLNTSLVLDTETTGLDKPEIIELAYLSIDNDLNFLPESIECQRFKPNKAIEQGALAVHGINDTDLADAPNNKNILQLMPQVATAQYIIGHHISYDIGALNNTLGGSQYKTICTKRLSAFAYECEPSCSLVKLIMKINPHVANKYTSNAHSADADVIMTAFLLKALASKIATIKGVEQTLDDLYSLSEEIGHIEYADYKKISKGEVVLRK